MGADKKIVSREEARKRVAGARAAGKRVVFANGCFDLLHGGHISHLEGARSAGDLLVVGVNSDASVRRLKGPGRPIMPASERMELLAALACVDLVVEFEEDNCARLLELLQPNAHAKGTDYTRETVPERETALRLGIEILITGDPKENATRSIVERINNAAD